MIEYINKRLNDWARWCVSDRVTLRHQLGAKSCWPQMLGESESTETVRQQGTLVPLNDLDCCLTDKAVCRLPPDLRRTVIEFYCRVGTTETVARRLGLTTRALFLRVERAHWHILGTLNDLAAGVILPPCAALPFESACIPLHESV